MLVSIKKLLPTTFKNNVSRMVYKIFTPPIQPTPVFVEEHPVTFSQAGEDKIISFLFNGLGIAKPTYLDIGANHPIHCNNTYLFYRNGGHGVCIEPDPELFEQLRQVRKNDICLNVAISVGEEKEADFYIFSLPSLNTLSKEEAELRQQSGLYKVEKVIKIPLNNINDILEKYFKKAPDLLSLDVEGLDYNILESINYELHRPLVICVETIAYSETIAKEKIPIITDFLLSKGYMVFADTHINTIFVDKEVYDSFK